MADDRLPLADLMAKSGDTDFLHVVAESVLPLIMEADVDGVIGAGCSERSADRHTSRYGYRDRTLETRLGPLNLKIPKLRRGPLLPGVPRDLQDGREGAGVGDPGGLDRRRQHAARPRAGSGQGHEQHLKVER